MNISSINTVNIPIKNGSKVIDNERQGMKFGDILKTAIKKVDELQKQADRSAVALATGDIQNLHQVMIDAEKAEIALQFTIQLRNKVLEAYQEIMRMQV